MKWTGLGSAMLGLTVMACSSAPDAAPDAGADTRPDAAGDAPVDADPSTLMSGVVVEPDVTTPIAGATVCLINLPEPRCTTTDATGMYSVALPSFAGELDVAINVTAPGHLGFTGLLRETSGGVVSYSQIPLLDDASAASALDTTRTGFSYPAPGKAFVRFEVTGAIGAHVQISPASGIGPVYVNASGVPDPELTALTSSGYALFGDLTPGPIEITVTGVACAARPLRPFTAEGWPATTPGAIAGVTVASSRTLITAFCE